MVSQIKAIVMKKFYYQKRNYLMMLLLGIISIIIIAIGIPDQHFSYESESSLTISFSTYQETITVYENEYHSNQV